MIALESVMKQIPSSWELVAYDQNATDVRDVTVLCRRESISDYDMNYVTWRCNTIEGGCHLGHYFDDEQKAQYSYAQRSNPSSRRIGQVLHPDC